MAKSYVRFEVSNDVVSKTYEALQMAKQSGGTVRKGTNEVTKSVERGLASFVVIAGDVEPEEVVVHIPSLCDTKKVAYSYVPSKTELGKSIGLNVPCTAVAVESQGNAGNAIREIIAKVTGSAQKAAPAAQAQKQERQPAADKPQPQRKEKAPKAQKQEAAAPAPEAQKA